MYTKSIDEITFEDVESFCKKWTEGVRVEYKTEIKDIPKIVSSLANMYGGMFLIGVEADKTKNKVIFPIKGISETPGIQEQIQQSALEGIYPAVIPQISLIDVSNSGNVVVVIRVDESVQAPHAIQNSTRVYIRTGSITEPYELADINRISHMLKRREDSQVITRQNLGRIEERVECSSFDTSTRNITVVARPIFPYRPVIPTSDIYSLLWGRQCLPRKVAGGACFIRSNNLEYTELNEYGIAYHRSVLCPANEQEFEYKKFLNGIWKLIQQASELYEKCEYLGNIEVSVTLKNVSGTKLLSDQRSLGPSSDPAEALDSEIFASQQCLYRDLHDQAEIKKIVENLTLQLLWAYNAPDFEEMKKRIRTHLERIKTWDV